MEVESKFNPDDWNGYLHTYETIEEYNAAKKLLPHVARIESTKEAKYTSREELPERYMWVDHINKTGNNVKNIQSYISEVENNYLSHHTYWNKTYKLIGKIKVENRIQYLWELCDVNGNDYFGQLDNNFFTIDVIDYFRYVVTNTIEIGGPFFEEDHKFKTCDLIFVNVDEDLVDYWDDHIANGTANPDDIEGGDSAYNVIFFITDTLNDL